MKKEKLFSLICLSASQWTSAFCSYRWRFQKGQHSLRYTIPINEKYLIKYAKQPILLYEYLTWFEKVGKQRLKPKIYC